MTESYSVVCMYACIYTHTYIHNIFFIHLSIDGHLGCFHILAIYLVAQM